MIAPHFCAWRKRSQHSSLACAAQTLSVIERQKIVRLLIKDILVGEDTITIRHSIPIPSGAPKNGGLESLDSQNYLLCKGRGFADPDESVHALRFRYLDGAYSSTMPVLPLCR
jgi:site-specific DNA recombinase